MSRLVEAILATAFTSKGSNRAASSSLAAARATLTPSVDPGGARAPPEKACPTASFSLFVNLDRYKDSILDIDRRTRMVSGLRIGGKECHQNNSRYHPQSKTPLISTDVNGICVHSNFRKKFVEEA
jgi:hypothetical protein